MKKTVSETFLINGEKISKSDKILASTGTLEELSSFIDIVKYKFFNENKSSYIFLFARFTQIQEAIDLMIKSLLTSKKNNAKYESSRFKLDFNEKDDFKYIKGSNQLNSHLLYLRSITRKAERQIIASRNVQLGLIPDEDIIIYLDKLGKYFLDLKLQQ